MSMKQSNSPHDDAPLALEHQIHGDGGQAEAQRLRQELQRSRERVGELEGMLSCLDRLGVAACWNRDSGSLAPDDGETSPFDVTCGGRAGQVHADDRARLQDVRSAAEQAQSGYQVTYRVTYGEGDEGLAKEVAEPVRDMAGRFLGHRGAFLDVTAYEPEAPKLRERPVNYLELVKSTADWVWEMDAEFRFTQISARLTAATGFDTDPFIGKHRWEIADGPADDETWSRHRALLEAHQPIRNFRYAFRDSDGRRRIALVSGDPVFDADSQFAGYIGIASDVTVEVEAQQALAESEARLAKAASMAKLGYWAWDEIEDRPLYGSEEFLKLFGFSSQEELFETITCREDLLERAHPEDREQHERTVMGALAEGKDLETMVRIVRPDGTTRYMRSVTERVIDSEGRLVRSLGIDQDITDSVLAQQELDRAHALLETAIEQSPTAIVIGDAPNGKIRFANSAALALRGLGDADATDQQGVLEFSSIRTLHRDGTPYRRDELLLAQALFHGRTKQNVESMIRRPDGSVSLLLGSCAPIKDRKGDIIAGITLSSDVTQLHETQRALRDSEERYRSIFEAMPVAVLDEDWSGCKRIIDDMKADGIEDLETHLIENQDLLAKVWRELKVRFWNPAAHEIYRTRSAAELRDFFCDWSRAEDPKFLTFLARQFAHLSRGASKFSEELELRVTDGSLVSVQMNTMIPEACRDSWQHVLVVEEDVSRRKEAEEKLHQAQKMEAVGQLTGGVAHDFNNVLGIVVGNLELIGDGLEPGSHLARRVSSAMEAADRGAALTDRLLAFSRKQPLEPRPIDIGPLMTSIRSMARTLLMENIEIDVRVAEDACSCMVDPVQLENALLNLAINARDAMPRGGCLTLEASCASVDDTHRLADLERGDYVAIAVSDNGTGISSDVLDHVFEPFFTTKETGQGSGLGLSMVYGFAKQSGGDVTIESAEGAGTTVRLYIPSYGGDGENAAASRSHKPAQASGGESILVVEDDPDLSALVRETLESLGYRVLEAGTASAALDILNAGAKIDLLLTDNILPGGMDGRTLVAELRQRDADLPMLVMSGYAEGGLTPEDRLPDDVQLIKKPFRKSTIAEALRLALLRRPTRTGS